MTTQSQVAVTISTARISITLDGRFRSFLRASEQGKKLEEAVKRVPQDIDEIRMIADVSTYIAAKTFGRVILDDKDRLRLDGVTIDYIAVGTFKRVLEEGFDIAPLVKFIENVDRNPDKSVAADLYAFLEKGNLPITEDGCFHAFKRVGQDYFDLHSHSVLYALDTTVEMDREKCDPNRTQTCSRGLHACSFDYLSQFHGGNGRILIVKINPKDVTAIPVDYNQAKLRTCKMQVIGEIPEDDAKKHFSSAVDRRYEPAPSAVDPEDATDATANDGVTTHEVETVTADEPPETVTTAPEADVTVAIDWAARGHASGYQAGIDDGHNEYDYDTSFDMPGELADGPNSARQAYAEAYVRGYGEGFAQAGDDRSAEDDDDGDLDAGAIDDDDALDANGFPLTNQDKGVEIAGLWGKEDAEADVAQYGTSDDLFDLSYEGGKRFDDIVGSALYNATDAMDDEKYADAYKAAYSPVLYATWAAKAKELGEQDGKAWAEGDTAFDAAPDNGDNYSVVDGLQDDEYENPWIELYNRAFVTAYVARFNEQNG